MTSALLPADRAAAALDRLGRLHPKRIDLTLERMHRILAALGHPERRLPPVVHVAGTNGKGSVTAILRAVAEAAGLRTHVYTSPHLVRFNERIRLAGRLIDDAHLAELLDRTERANGDLPITYFEVTTAAAFLAFAEVPADLLILEVGLGGRLDATTVIDRREACFISRVSLDHHAFLGVSSALIAAEKAGIIKPDSPLVVAPQPPEVAAVIARVAAAHGVDPVWVDRGRVDGPLDLPAWGPLATDGYLTGAHQCLNAAVALTAASVLAAGGMPIAARHALAARGRVDWPARLQRLDRGALLENCRAAEIWLDGGHNPDGGAVIARWLDETASPGRPAHLIVGMKTAKDTAGYLSHFAGRVAGLQAIAIPDEACVPPAELVATARRLGIAADQAENLRDAVGLVPAGAKLLIAGSLYLAGHVLRVNGTPPL
ncbi:MAG: bifunctional folylpolyglutamate synthase/dihydrofolate synthase [Azospirillaceae bacterium]